MGVTGDFNAVNWPTFLKVVAAIIISIFLTGIGGFFIQRIFRGAVGDKSDDHKTGASARSVDCWTHTNISDLVHGYQRAKGYLGS